MRAMRPALLLALLAGLSAAAEAQELTVSVAVSLKEAVQEVGRGFAASRKGVTLRYNVGASGDLQKQIEAGAPVDLFLSAADRPMDELERMRLIVAASRRAFARNALAVVKPADSRIDVGKPADLLGGRVSRIVIGNPRTVPAGQYAEESLRALGVWERVRHKLVFAENVRQALDYVARGEADAGFVYVTDVAARARGVAEAFRPPESAYRPIVHPIAVVVGARHPALAQAFVDQLTGASGQAVLARFGFQPPPAGAR